MHTNMYAASNAPYEHLKQYASDMVCVYSNTRAVRPSAVAMDANVVLQVQLWTRSAFSLVACFLVTLDMPPIILLYRPQHTMGRPSIQASISDKGHKCCTVQHTK